MNTGREVLYRALQLLGYTDGYGEVDPAQDAELMRRGITAITQILTDLRGIESPGWVLEETLSMDSPLPLSLDAINDIMPYGVAMLLAQSEGEGDSQAMFATLYNRKRASISRPLSRRVDVIPRGVC